MFTGLVQGVGTVAALRPVGSGARLEIELGALGECAHEGDSVAVDGICLTVAGRTGATHAFDAIAQTLALTTLGGWRVGDTVNLECALRAGDPMGGHIVQGHVEQVGIVESVRAHEQDYRVRVRVAAGTPLVAQGSIAIDGVSLTIAACEAEWCEVALIPETLARTTLASLRAGSRVNIECDPIARLVDAAVRRHLAR